MIKVGINGFGRIGRLILRAAWERQDITFVQINDPLGDTASFAHLLMFDSVHGRWQYDVSCEEEAIIIDSQPIRYSRNHGIAETDWSSCDLVIEASGVMKSKEKLEAYLDQGVKRVVVTAPIKEEGILNIVMGVNHREYCQEKHSIVTAASCTTNALAPVVKVLHTELGIEHGSITTIHSITNTQVILDSAHKDLRRARACSSSLIPTSTGAATAIAHIFPELTGRLNGHAIRVPLANASLVDCVFEVKKKTSAKAVNDFFREAATNELWGILGYEERALVSIDYKTDPHSSIIDALSTMVINDTQVKVYSWYDNEWGYSNRLADLISFVGATN